MSSEEQTAEDSYLNLFQEGIKSENIHERLFTAGNIWLVAAAIGPENTRSKLLPYIQQATELTGEVQSIIAEQLGNSLKYVGGHEYASHLLNVLKLFADSEESFVRDKAISSISKICLAIPSPSCDTLITNNLQSLFTSTAPSSRISACALLPSLYERVSDQNKAKLRRSFIAAVKDEAPIVRRAAIHTIPDLCSVYKSTVIMGEIVRQGLTDRLNDDDDSIRVMIPDCLPPIAAKVTPADRQNSLVPLAKALAKDSSWWVRAKMAKTLSAFVPYFATALDRSDIGAIILFLLRDPDPEVKTAACLCCKQIVDVFLKVPSFFIDSVFPDISALVTDRFKQVREEVAGDLLWFGKVTGPTVLKETIFPLFISLISDKERDVVLSALKSINPNFSTIDSFSLTQAVLPKLVEIAKKEDWRVKVEIIKLLPLFLPFINTEAVPVQIIPLIAAWLHDAAFAVRETISQTLPQIIKVADSETVTDDIIAVLLKLIYDPGYSVREAALLAINYLTNGISRQLLLEKLVPNVVLLASDPVPNVRLLAARTLNAIKKYLGSEAPSNINMTLNLLTNIDADEDVRYFAAHPDSNK